MHRCCRCMPDSNLAELFLLRHGIAEERRDGWDHPERALTLKGRVRTRAVVTALVRRGLAADRLVTSPYRRALETAQIALEAALAPVLEIDAGLEPGGQLRPLIHQLSGRVCLVGHEPDLGSLGCQLLGLPPGALSLKKAGLLHLSRSDRGWRLLALLRPSLLLDSREA